MFKLAENTMCATNVFALTQQKEYGSTVTAHQVKDVLNALQQFLQNGTALLQLSLHTVSTARLLSERAGKAGQCFLLLKYTTISQVTLILNLLVQVPDLVLQCLHLHKATATTCFCTTRIIIKMRTICTVPHC